MYFRDDATFSLTCQCIVCLKFTCRLRRIFPSEKELRERKHTRRRKQREGDSKKKERGSGGEERRGRAQGEGQECRLCLTVYSLNHQGVWAAADGPLSNVLMYGASLNNSGLSARSPAERKKKNPHENHSVYSRFPLAAVMKAHESNWTLVLQSACVELEKWCRSDNIYKLNFREVNLFYIYLYGERIHPRTPRTNVYTFYFTCNGHIRGFKCSFCWNSAAEHTLFNMMQSVSDGSSLSLMTSRRSELLRLEQREPKQTKCKNTTE